MGYIKSGYGWIGLAVAAICLLGQPSRVRAYSFFIDNFEVIRGPQAAGLDRFDDGNPPPDYGGTIGYNVGGATFGPETGGKLTLNSSGAVLNGTGTRLQQRAIYITNVNPAAFNQGLKDNVTFSVTGIFDFILPTRLGERYGVMLTDVTSTNTTSADELRLEVARKQNGYRVDLSRHDNGAQTTTVLETMSLEQLHDQIALTLTRSNTSNNEIAASFAYIDDGTAGSESTFTSRPTIFNEVVFTRAGFLASTPVPEPSTLLILGLGLAGFELVRKPKHAG